MNHYPQYQDGIWDSVKSIFSSGESQPTTKETSSWTDWIDNGLDLTTKIGTTAEQWFSKGTEILQIRDRLEGVSETVKVQYETIIQQQVREPTAEEKEAIIRQLQLEAEQRAGVQRRAKAAPMMIAGVAGVGILVFAMMGRGGGRGRRR